MKHILLNIFLIISFAACNLNKHESNFSKTGKFYPGIEQRSLIIGQITNLNEFNNAPTRIILFVDDITLDCQHTFETEIDKQGNFLFDIPLYHAINTYLKYGNSRITPYLFPNDTLHLKCQIDRKNGRIGIVSGKFNEKHDKFQNDFFRIHTWIVQELNAFRDHLPHDLSPQVLKARYFDFESDLLKKIEELVINDSLNHLLHDYMRYSASYSIYEDIIKLGRNIENIEERQEFYSFITDSIAFNENALITSEYNSFLNKMRYNVELHPPVFLEPKERTKEEFRQEITTKQLEQNLNNRNGIWAEYLAASHMFHTGFLEEEINQSVITIYAQLIEEKFKDPYIKQMLLSKCDETREKVARINRQTIPEKAFLNQFPDLSGEDLWNKILEDNKEKIIYIDIWATWCSPCKREIAHSVKLQEMFNEVAFVYLCSQSSEVTWKNVIKQYQVKGTHILITQGQYNYLKERFSVAHVPHYILIDKDGSIDFNDYPGCKTDQVIEERLKILAARR